MAEGGGYIRGFGWDVPKETPRQLLGELEAERDLEREEERLEAEAQANREIAEANRERYVSYLLDEFDEKLYPERSWDDDRPIEEHAAEDIVEHVRVYKEMAMLQGLGEAVPKLGEMAMRQILLDPSLRNAEFFDFRKSLRSLNEIARICGLSSIPERNTNWGEQFDPSGTSERLLWDAIHSPLAAFARLNQDFSDEADRVGSPLFSERDIDTLGSHVTTGSLLRQALRGLSVGEQCRAVGNTVTRHFAYLAYDSEQGPIPLNEFVVENAHLLRKAFPAAKGEILSRFRDQWNGRYVIDFLNFRDNPIRSLSNFRLARQFARESGINGDWKRAVSELLSSLNEIPSSDPKHDQSEAVSFASRLKTLRAVAAEAWEYLPASLARDSKAVRNMLLDPGALTETGFKAYADALGIDWIPGEKWPVKEDVRALYETVFFELEIVGMESCWKTADALERITGWDRFEFVSPTLLGLAMDPPVIGNPEQPVPRTKEEFMALVRSHYVSGSDRSDPSLPRMLGMARAFCGPEAFSFYRAFGATAQATCENLFGSVESVWTNFRDRDHRVIAAFAAANGMTEEQTEYLRGRARLSIADQVVRAKELGLIAPTVTDETFVSEINDVSFRKFVAALGKNTASAFIRRVSPSLSISKYIILAETAEVERLPIPRITVAQISDAVYEKLTEYIAPFVGKNELTAYFAEHGSDLGGYGFVTLYTMARRLKMPVPDIDDYQLQSALSSQLGDETVRLIGEKRFGRMIRRRVENDPFCPIAYFIDAAQVAKRHGIAVPAITERLFAEAVERQSLAELLPIVPGATMERGCATIPAGKNLDSYLERLKFSKANGLPCPEMTAELFAAAVSRGKVPEIVPLLDIRRLSDFMSGYPIESLNIGSWRTVVTEHLAVLKSVFSLNPKAHQRGIVGLLLRLNGIQPPSRNVANDPWVEEIGKIVREAGLASPEDAERLVDYVRSYGMVCAPELVRVHDWVFRAGTVARVNAYSRRVLESIGVRFPSAQELVKRPELPVRVLLDQLKEIIAAIPTRLLRGERVDGLDTGIGNELFKVLLGETRWGRDDSVAATQRILAETERRIPTSARIPSAFRESELLVQEACRSAGRPTEERVEAFLSSREVRERFGGIADGWAEGLAPTDGAGRLKKIREAIRYESEASLHHLRMALDSDDAAYADYLASLGPTERVAAERRRAVAVGERGRAGLEKQASLIRTTLADSSSAEVGTGGEQGLIEWIAANGSGLASSGEWLRELSARQMAGLMPDGMRQAVERAVEERRAPTLAALNGLAEVQRQFVHEHYLQAEQNPEHTGHPPFSRAAVRALEKAWQLGESKSGKMPIEELLEKGERISRGKETAESADLAVRMIPVAGLLRVYAGEIGDACYSSKHLQLANGSYPNLNAWLFATTDQNDRLTLRGSALALDVKTNAGVPVLVVRANNPKENFVRGLDTPAFVRGTLLEAVATARRQWNERGQDQDRGTQIVSIPMDAASQSSTNRPSVAADYHRRFRNNPRLSLLPSPETQFNGYNLTNPYGSHPCVEIWRIDADGKETWTGDWN